MSLNSQVTILSSNNTKMTGQRGVYSIIVQAARFSATVQDRSGFHDKKDKRRFFVFIKRKNTDTRMN
jgi:hypothetical protein